MTVKLSPIGNDAPFLDASGIPLNAGQLFTYLAGSVSTSQTTYTDSAGTVPNAMPIILNSNGYPASGGNVVEIWLTSGVAYKFVLKTAAGVTVWSRDNISGINDATITLDEWISGPAPTYVSATSFTLVGDQTTAFHVGRRIKATISAGTSYGTITASVFGALTTVTVDTTGSNALDSGLSAVSYGLLSASNFSQSIGLDVVARQSADIASAGTLNLDAAGGDLVDVTGTTTITAITLARGKIRTVRFTGALTLTNGASLVLPGGANITTASGDYAIFRGYAAGIVRCIAYTKAALPPGSPTIGNVQKFLTSGTYTPTAGMRFCRVTVVAGGGAGGGAPATGAAQVSVGSGGAGGGAAIKTVSAATVGASQTVTVGAGGTANSGAAGGAGGTSSFGAICSATGGGGGNSSVAGTNASANGVAGGVGSNGDVNLTGGPSDPGVGFNASTTVMSGSGGNSFFGGGAPGVVNTSGVSASANTGGGGSGAAETASAGALSGGAGGSGIVVVEEFF